MFIPCYGIDPTSHLSLYYREEEIIVFGSSDGGGPSNVMFYLDSIVDSAA